MVGTEPLPHLPSLTQHRSWEAGGGLQRRGGRTTSRWVCVDMPAEPPLGQDVAHLCRPGCRENKHPVMGCREEGKDPAPDPAAESEKLIIARRPEMHPTVIKPSGKSLLGKEATSGLPGPTVQRWGAAGQRRQHVASHALELEAGRGFHLQAKKLADSHLPEGGRERTAKAISSQPHVCARLNFHWDEAFGSDILDLLLAQMVVLRALWAREHSWHQ